MDGPKSERLNVEATHISSWPRHQWSDRKKVSMMYYFFCVITFVFNCVLQTSSTCNVFMLLKVVLTSVDRLSIDDAYGSIIDVLTMPDADVPRWQLICFYGITSTCVKTKIYLNQARTISQFMSSQNLVQCRINNFAFTLEGTWIIELEHDTSHGW